jgi:hypothetical protein
MKPTLAKTPGPAASAHRDEDDGKSPNWSKERRQQFIDFRLQWDSRLNRGDLTQFFDISVQQASADISDYAAQWPKNIEYDKSSKTYVAPATFKAAYRTSGTQQYLAQLLASHEGVLPPDRSLIGFQPPTASVPVPERTVDESTLKQLIRAIQGNLTLEVEYQSITREEPTSRFISPHAFVHDGMRWHVRAYCHLRNRFDDIVVGRIFAVKDVRAGGVDASDDAEWHELVDLVLAPHPALSPAQKHAIEVDYRMKGGQAHLECRRAMLYYTLRRLGLEDDGSPREYPKQVVLANHDQLKPIIKAIPRAR